ncbi:MAG: rhodanese-like domain-containing protein [Acidimicrobiia bacterium]|nr:rhodanese-like domain-containing protein [Acidimicrobiia bacterium]
MTARIDVDELRARWFAGGELALLDAREQGAFSAEHLFWACCLPLSVLELRLGELVPRRDTPIVWCDDGASGLAERAAARAEALGWTDVAVLDGGNAAWARAGHELYSGVNVPSKAFGEFVETVYGTPHLPAAELAERIAAGDDLVILDSRPMREFNRMSIPGGVDCPGAELAYRVHDVAPDPATTVVVNCAGRTRSIIGAQSLINAGIPNRVVALENGTMGWELAGFSCAHGERSHAPDPSAGGLARAEESAARVARRFGVVRIDHATLDRWLADRTRTTVVLDVRSPEEFDAGHLPNTRSAPGGQLVQATDEYVATWRSRMVLVDDTGVRATMTASWLRQLGVHEVAVLERAFDARSLVSGPAEQPAEPLPSVPTIEPAELAGLPGAAVVDLADSIRYRRRHLAGAWWGVRSRFAEAVAAIAPAPATVVLTSPDGVLATLAHADAAAAWPLADVRVLAGGTAAALAAGCAAEAGFDRPTTTADDVWYKPYDADDQEVVRQHMQDYLTWEVALVAQIERDDMVSFQRF